MPPQVPRGQAEHAVAGGWEDQHPISKASTIECKGTLHGTWCAPLSGNGMQMGIAKQCYWLMFLVSLRLNIDPSHQPGSELLRAPTGQAPCWLRSLDNLPISNVG